MTKKRILPLVVLLAGLLGVSAPSTAAAPVSITHSQSLAIASSLTFICDGMPGNATASYMRVFDLPDFGIDGFFTVSDVDVGVGQVSSATGSQNVVVNLYTLMDELVFANLTLIGSNTMSVPDSAQGTIVNFQVEGVAPPGSTLVVEILTPNGQATGDQFGIGTNTVGETDPSYVAALECDLNEPVPIGTVIPVPFHFVMEVHGDALPPPIDFCVNSYTGALSEPHSQVGCPPGTQVVTMPVPEPVTLCINSYTGKITWSPSGSCAAGRMTHIVPDDGSLSYCRNIYTGGLRYSANGTCTANETPGVIPGA